MSHERTTSLDSKSKELLLTLQQNQVAVASKRRQVHDTGAFLVTLGSKEIPWSNCAFPIRAPITVAAIEAMKRVFFEADRNPRLEILEPLWPTLGPALEAAGFQLEGHMPLMVCTPALFRSAPLVGDARVPEGEAEEALVIEVGNAAFGAENGITLDSVSWLSKHRQEIDEGELVLGLAYLEETAAASAFLMRDGRVAELAGVATRPEFRRRGLARAVSSLLLGRFFHGGGEVAWLSAADDAARAVYEGLGFLSIGAQSNYGWPG